MVSNKSSLRCVERSEWSTVNNNNNVLVQDRVPEGAEERGGRGRGEAAGKPAAQPGGNIRGTGRVIFCFGLNLLLSGE